MSEVVSCQRRRLHDVDSPSARDRAGPSSDWKDVAPFNQFADLDTMVARTVVGCYRHRHALVVLRACSRELRNVVDDEVALWCARFQQCQRRQVHGMSKGVDLYYRCIVQTELMIVEAFGALSDQTRVLMQVSQMDRETYMAVLQNQCVLCGCKMTNEALVSDSEAAGVAPGCVFAHQACQRKHMVVLTNSQTSIQRCAEPRSLHKELCDVASAKPRGISIDYTSVRNSMSPWFNRMYAAYHRRVANCPIVVWLGEHPRVRPEDTLYGALGITKEDVALALQEKANSEAKSQELLKQRRARCAKARKLHARTLEAELRVWLGRGRTRWRSIEDLDAFHPKLLDSTGIDHFVDPFMKRSLPPNISTYTHMLNMLDRTVCLLDCPSKGAMVDWVVSHLRVDNMFSGSPCDYCPSEFDWSASSIEAEAGVHSRVLNALSKCTPSDVDVSSCKIVDTRRLHSEINYNIKMSVSLNTRDGALEGAVLLPPDGIKCELVSKFVVSHTSLCKLKFVVGELMSEKLQRTLPSVPVCSSVLTGTSRESLLAQEEIACSFLSSVLKACMSRPGGERARVHALSLLVSWKAYREIVQALRSDSSGDWVPI